MNQPDIYVVASIVAECLVHSSMIFLFWLQAFPNFPQMPPRGIMAILPYLAPKLLNYESRGAFQLEVQGVSLTLRIDSSAVYYESARLLYRTAKRRN